MDKLIFSAQPKKVTTTVDKTLTLVMGTQELSPEDAATLMGFMHDQVFVMLARKPISDAEANDFEAPDDFPDVKAKSPSQRLRNVLYRIWELKGKPGDFETAFYPLTMESIIAKQKEILSGLDPSNL